MADSLFDFELLESSDVLVDYDPDEAVDAVAAAETAQLETDQDEMAILADYVVPVNKTPEDLARDLEAMVSGVNTLSLQATQGTAVVVAPLAVATTSSSTTPASSQAPASAVAAPPSGMVSPTPPSSPPATSLAPAPASAADVLPGGTTASSVDIPKGTEEPSDVDMVQPSDSSKPVEPSVESTEVPVPMDTTPPGLEAASTTTSSRKRPLDRGDNAGALAGASGPDTGIPSAESPVEGALVGSAVSGASAGASCPDTEPTNEAPPSSVRTAGSLVDCGKLLPPTPSSTLRTTLATSVPLNQRLQAPVTFTIADDGNLLLDNVMAGLPCLPRKLEKPLRGLQVGEIVDLCLKFDVTKLTPAGFSRIVEVYSIAKAKKLAEEIWEAKHLRKGSRSMDNLTTLPESEAKVPYMCGNCFTSWLVPKASKCLHCGTVGQKVPTALPSASVTVDGVTWTMTFDADQQLRWQSDAADLGDQQKSTYSVEVSSLGQCPPAAAASPAEISFSELVSDSSRLTLRQEVLNRGDDEVFQKPQVERKPQRAQDNDPGQETVTFHPSNVKAMRLVAELRQAERREKNEHSVDAQMGVVYALQTGAQSIDSSEAQGAAVLRHLDVEKFRNFLKRKWQDDKGQPHDALLSAQTTLEQAKQQNQAYHQKQKRKLELLRPTSEGISVWPTKVRKALESGLLEPERGPMAVEGEHLQEVKEAYLRTRELINTGTNPFNSRLLEEVPDCLLNMKFMEYQEEPSTGASCPDMGGSSAAASTSTDTITKEIVNELEPGSGEAKLAMIHAMLGYHKGEVRAYGGQWTIAPGPLTLPDWASKKVDSQAVLALERRTHPYNMKTRWGDLMEYTQEEIDIHVAQRKRPPVDKVVGLFWAPGTDGDGWHWRRDVSTWTLPVLLGALGYEYTLRELYNIWCFMPLIVQTQVRGQKNVEKNNQRLKTYSTLKEETQNFLEACGLPLKPSTQAEWKVLYREMGAFMAASSFITHTPPCIMELPPAAVRDSKQHMIERAICDERITLPLAALKDVDAVYAKLLPQLGAASMVEIKVAWRCTEEQWWVAKVTDPAKAAAIYRKLSYSDATIVGMGLPHPDAPPTGAPGPDMGGALLDEHLPDSQVNYPQLTVDCVESIAGTDYKKKQFKDKSSHVFWGRLECGLILSSISPWDVVTKESGVTRGGYVCKHCKGFWKSKRGSSRFVQIQGRHKGQRVSLQLILDEPPQALYSRWIKSRVEYYTRMEPQAPLRDECLDIDPNTVSRLRFSRVNNMEHISDLLWGIIFSNPEADGLRQIHDLAAKRLAASHR